MFNVFVLIKTDYFGWSYFFVFLVEVVVWLYVQCRFRVRDAIWDWNAASRHRFELIREDHPNKLKYESSSKLLRRKEGIWRLNLYRAPILYLRLILNCLMFF